MNRVMIHKLPQPSYACSEAINTLCTNLTFSGTHVRKIMITSCHASEGKTFISMNVMQTMARLGYRVALVEADLRRGMIATRYKLQYEDAAHAPGLAQFLAGMAEVEDVLYETNVEGAYIIPIGRTVSNSLSLLNSPRFEWLLDHLTQYVDYVIVDAAPVGQVIDAAQIAKSCDGTVLVISYNTVRRQELIDARDQMIQTGCPILGTVLNNVEYDSYMNKKYYHKAYYAPYRELQSEE